MIDCDCDGVDADEEYFLRATLTIVGDRAEVDLSGTSRQARASINATWLEAKTAVGVALKFLLDALTPFASGVYRTSTLQCRRPRSCPRCLLIATADDDRAA